MAVESTAVFKERMVQLGLEEFWDAFEQKGWTSYGIFAYSSSYTPGSQDDSKFLKEVVAELLGSEGHQKAAVVRRLYFESYTVATAELRRRHDRTEDEAPRKIPATEKEARRKVLAEKLRPGLRMVDDLDPSYCLIDSLCQMHDDNNLLYVAWDECTKREQDLCKTKKDKQWRPDAAGIVKERAVERGSVAELGTDLLLRYALQRRGLAFEIADLMDYDTHQNIVDLLLREYMRAPPHGYAKVSLEQICRADREIFKGLQDACRSGIRRDVAGARPLDSAVPRVLDSERVRLLLVPMHGAAHRGAGGGGHESRKRSRSTSRSPEQGASRAAKKRRAKLGKLEQENQRLQKDVEALRKNSDYNRRDDDRGSQNKGKGKGRGRETPMPKALIGKSATTKDGEPICFGFNLPQGCNDVEAGKRCRRGWHVPMPAARQ